MRLDGGGVVRGYLKLENSVFILLSCKLPQVEYEVLLAAPEGNGGVGWVQENERGYYSTRGM